MIKYLIPLLLVSVAAFGQPRSTIATRTPGPVIITTPGGGGTSTIITNGIDGTTASSIAQTNIAGKVPNMLNSGTNVFRGVIGFTNNGNIVAGGAHTISGGLSNIVLSARNVTITDSENSGVFASHPESTIINNSQNAVIIGGAAVEIHNTVESVIVGGTHSSIGGSSTGGNNGNNIILGGGGVNMGDEFSTDPQWSMAAVGSQAVSFSGTNDGGGVYSGVEIEVFAATNAVVLGGKASKITKTGAVILGGVLRTNTENEQVLLGRYGKGLTISTNTGTLVESALTVNGGFTNTAAWGVESIAAVAGQLVTNGNRRVTIHYTGTSAEFGAQVVISLVSYNQGNTGTNVWDKHSVWDADGDAFLSVQGPVSPNQVFYIDASASISTANYKLVY